MDSSNKINSFGRVEIRHFDGWHALCGKGDNYKLAMIICQSAGYEFGSQIFPNKTPDDIDNTGCGAYCGDDSVNRLQLICPDNAKMVNDCQVVNTVICDSFNDLIVQCLDFIPSANPPDFQRD